MSLKPSNYHGRLILKYYLTYPIVITKKDTAFVSNAYVVGHQTATSKSTPLGHTLLHKHTLVHNCVVQSCDVFPLSKHLLQNSLQAFPQIADCSVCWQPKGIEQSTQRQADETVAHTVSSSGKLNLPSGAGFHISLLF